MNIKLVKIGKKWFVVVNSVAGEFKQDVTTEITKAIESDIEQNVKKSIEAKFKLKIDKMQEAIDGCINSLGDFIDY